MKIHEDRSHMNIDTRLSLIHIFPKQPAAANRQENDPDITAEPAPPLTEVLDGDRESLPE